MNDYRKLNTILINIWEVKVMKRYIRYHTTNSPFNCLLKGIKFYYLEEMELYVSKTHPLIYLKELGENVNNVKWYDSINNSLIPFDDSDFFEVHLNQYIVITYNDGTSKKFQLVKDSFGLMEFEQFT